MKYRSFHVAFIVAICLIHGEASYDCPKDTVDIVVYCSKNLTSYYNCFFTCHEGRHPKVRRPVRQIPCPDEFDKSLWIICVRQADGKSCINQCYRPVDWFRTNDRNVTVYGVERLYPPTSAPPQNDDEKNSTRKMKTIPRIG